MIAYWDRGCEWMGEGLQLAICPSFTGSTSTMALDISGNVNHGTLTNMDRNASWVANGEKLALDFDGVNDYVTIPHSNSLMPTSPGFSVSAWVIARSNSSPVYSFVSKGGMTSPENDWSLFHYQGKLQFGCDSAFANVGYSLAYPFSGHICGTYDKPTKIHRIYFNGEEVFSYVGTGSAINQQSAITIGAETEIGNVAFFTSMQIDDVRILKRTLTAAEIKIMYNLGRSGGMLYQPPKRRSVFIAAGFKAYWHRRQSQLIGGGV